MITLHTRRLGTPGAPPALLGHCFLGHGGSWAPVLRAMQVPLEALAPDLPGHGLSPTPVDPVDLHALAAGALSERILGPTLLMGHSFGGASMLRAALMNPALVRGLVLVEPIFPAITRSLPGFEAYLREEAEVQEALEAGDWERAARLFLGRNPGSPDLDTLPAPAREAILRQVRLLPHANAGLMDDSGGILVPGRLEGFTPPVLLVTGGATAPIFPKIADQLAERLPQAERAVIAEAGHMAPLSHPRPLAALIDDWLRRHGLAG